MATAKKTYIYQNDVKKILIQYFKLTDMLYDIQVRASKKAELKELEKAVDAWRCDIHSGGNKAADAFKKFCGLKMEDYQILYSLSFSKTYKKKIRSYYK